MTRLTTIGHTPSSQRQPPERQPTRDFAEALAKDHGAASSGYQVSTMALASKQMPEEPAHAAGTTVLAQAASASAAKASVSRPASHPGHRDLVSPGVSGPARLPIESLVLPAERELLSAKVSPVGITEAMQSARVFGVHLLAGCYLSEVSLRDAQPEIASHAAGHAVPDSGFPSAASASGLDAMPLSLSEAERLLSGQNPAFAMMESIADTEVRRTDEAAPLPVTDQSLGATEVAWSERVLRITGEREGHAVAWLRDYRLDEGTERKLVQSVLLEARTHGVKLAKIIVNGREAWASREAI